MVCVLQNEDTLNCVYTRINIEHIIMNDPQYLQFLQFSRDIVIK
jgi:hypothetical protein